MLLKITQQKHLTNSSIIYIKTLQRFNQMYQVRTVPRGLMSYEGPPLPQNQSFHTSPCPLGYHLLPKPAPYTSLHLMIIFQNANADQNHFMLNSGFYINSLI